MAKVTSEALKEAVKQFARMGGAARAKALSKRRRKQIARDAARARWGRGRA